VQTEREETSGARKRNPNNLDEDEELQRKTRYTIGQMTVVKSQNDLVSSQLCLYQENKESFISIMGEDKYHETIMSLLKKLPDPDVLRTIQTEESGNRRNETGVNGSDDEEGS
jgi:hypothetical protein